MATPQQPKKKREKRKKRKPYLFDPHKSILKLNPMTRPKVYIINNDSWFSKDPLFVATTKWETKPIFARFPSGRWTRRSLPVAEDNETFNGVFVLSSDSPELIRLIYYLPNNYPFEYWPISKIDKN